MISLVFYLLEIFACKLWFWYVIVVIYCSLLVCLYCLLCLLINGSMSMVAYY